MVLCVYHTFTEAPFTPSTHTAVVNCPTPAVKPGTEHATHVNSLQSMSHADYPAVLSLFWTVSDVAVDRSFVASQSLVMHSQLPTH